MSGSIVSFRSYPAPPPSPRPSLLHFHAVSLYSLYFTFVYPLTSLRICKVPNRTSWRKRGLALDTTDISPTLLVLVHLAELLEHKHSLSQPSRTDLEARLLDSFGVQATARIAETCPRIPVRSSPLHLEASLVFPLSAPVPSAVCIPSSFIRQRVQLRPFPPLACRYGLAAPSPPPPPPPSPPHTSDHTHSRSLAQSRLWLPPVREGIINLFLLSRPPPPRPFTPLSHERLTGMSASMTPYA